MIKQCKICGKDFETKTNRSVCYDKHIRICKICGKEFEVNSWPYTQVTCGKDSCRLALVRNSKTLRKCEYCGKEFVAESPHQKYCKYHIKKCVICGKEFKVSIKDIDNQTCGSKECIQMLREQTNEAKFGTKNPMQNPDTVDKMKQNNLEKYGKEWIVMEGENKEKQHSTMQSKYGYMYTSQVPKFKDQARNTMLTKYGGEYTMTSPTLREQVIQTNLQRYGVPFYCMTDDYQKYQRNLISSVNKKFAEKLESVGLKISFEKRIGNRQFDLEVVGQNILVEINPTITHNSYMSIFNKESHGLDRMYHFNKSMLASSTGYRCIHVFDWDDQDKIVNVLNPSKITLYARNLTVKEVSDPQCKEFEVKYHLQNSCKNQSVKYGLFDDNELVEIMTFGKPRYTQQYEWELLRLCTSSDCAVVGGAEKLFKHFIQEHDPKSIISYCDLSKFNGDVYQRLGMELDHISPPAKIWSNGTERITDNLLRQRGYDQLFNTNYGKGTSNEALILENGWLPVYDCGQAVYIFHSDV